MKLATIVVAATCLTLSIAAQAKEDNWSSKRDYVGYGFEAFMDYLEESRGLNNENRGNGERGRAEIEKKERVAEPFISGNNDGVSARYYSPECSYIWMTSGHRWSYSSFIPLQYVKNRMWVDSATFWGMKNSPDGCGRLSHNSDRLETYPLRGKPRRSRRG